MKKITATVDVNVCTLKERWTLIVPDHVAETIREEPEAMLEVADGAHGDDHRLHIEDESVDNEEERTVVASSVEVVDVEGDDLDLLEAEQALARAARKWRDAAGHCEFAAMRYIIRKVRKALPQVTAVCIEGEYNEEMELRAHICEMRGGDDLLDEADWEDLEAGDLHDALLYLTDTSGEDWLGVHELDIPSGVSVKVD